MVFLVLFSIVSVHSEDAIDYIYLLFAVTAATKAVAQQSLLGNQDKADKEKSAPAQSQPQPKEQQRAAGIPDVWVY